jgi:hypothetical protein
MSQPHEDQQHSAHEGLEPFTLIIDETPMFGPGTDTPARTLIKDLMEDLAKHARQHAITLH